ncbi:fumarylacetoacetate hydrolase family protein [Reichenbachiella carrageenanivorans]|uniref:Fumarylacetoacetate hydrolase family protein n=1 Tax=Reichenbachiella carrageenanivorans TaxID=2979869 RepID=A0ABY6CWS0_9BACT|nr:fumarylacetoacetate hydrolase family protein [Reichenbachiella carrageenanivorans]UXX78159.1 fumarylacetoacetate hydrolase family protein [Reichenbachiella carrageenanivorans]
MKILAIGRNYAKHIEELNNERPDEPVVFGKPETAILKNNAPFYYPDFSTDIHYEVEILLKICKVGKNIDEKFAHKYYDEIGIGVDFTARDLQSKAKTKGLPWDLAKGFNGSAPISEFISKSNYDLSNLNFGLKKDGQDVQVGNTSMMLFSFDYIVSYVSKFFMLKKGDIIFTGTPEGVGPIQIGNRLEAFIEDKKMMDFEIK